MNKPTREEITKIVNIFWPGTYSRIEKIHLIDALMKLFESKPEGQTLCEVLKNDDLKDSPDFISKEQKEVADQKRVEFMPRYTCDHAHYIKGDMCYGCGTPAYLCEIDIAERIHKQKMRHIREIKNS